MPTELQLLRASAITSYFKDHETDNLVKSRRVHKLVFAFCKQPTPQIFCSRGGSAFALLTDWGSVVTWGLAAVGGDSSAVAAQLSGSAVGSIYNQKLRDTGMTELPLGLSISEFSKMRTS